MPIDLKWVQNHPEQVLQWQTLRELDKINSLNNVIIPLDRNVRELAHKIQLERRRLNQISNELRNKNVEKKSLLEERQDLQKLVADQEQELASIRRMLQQELWTLGSPVDTSSDIQTLGRYKMDEVPRRTKGNDVTTMERENFDFSCNVGCHLSRLMANFVIQFFGIKYTNIHTLPLRHHQLELLDAFADEYRQRAPGQRDLAQ